MSCTTLDHVYPTTHDGTPCFCGKRRWNQDARTYAGPTTRPAPPTTMPRRGAAVIVRYLGQATRVTVTEVDREAGMFRTETHSWFEPTDIIR